MKKFYLVCLAAFIGFTQSASAQNYTASFGGNWSDPSVWGASGIPSNPCLNCTITIKDGVNLTMDISFLMSGTSRLIIGTAGAFQSSVTMSTTNAANISAGHNIILLNEAGDRPSIKLVSSRSGLGINQLAGTTGTYDGVFYRFPPPDHSYVKVIGIAPSVVLADGVSTFGTAVPQFGSSLPNAAHPGLTSFSLNSDGTLPVVLTRFEASYSNGSVSLAWTTAQEINSDYFEVQRSTDMNNWQAIGTVAAKGFSSITANYSYVDASPSSGVNYYRLKIVDKDGKYKNSKIAVVNGEIGNGLKVFPNPANNFVSVTLGNDMTLGTTIRLMNQFGQVLQERKLEHGAGSTITLSLQNYPQGNYILQLTGQNGAYKREKY